MSAVIMIAASILACLLIAGAWGFPADDNSRIVGGTLAELGEFPWVVSLQGRNTIGGHFCGGSIISPKFILTASHCVDGQSASAIQIQYGVIDNKERKNVIRVKSITMHEDYVHGGSFPNDIAVMELEKPMVLDGVNARAVRLPNAEADIKGDSVVAELCGWGYRTSEEQLVQRYLLFTELPLFNHDICKRQVGVKYNPDLHVCAGSLDGKHKQCSGDSGGPLTVFDIQYGVVSWSFKPCTITSRPGIFANVAKYRGWIRDKTGV